MGALTVVKVGPAAPPESRWGDYFGMALDPVDRTTLWYVGEYQAQAVPDQWGTEIGSFRLGCSADFNCDTFVNGTDFDEFSAAFELGSHEADYNADGFVTGTDFDLFSADFGVGC